MEEIKDFAGGVGLGKDGDDGNTGVDAGADAGAGAGGNIGAGAAGSSIQTMGGDGDGSGLSRVNSSGISGGDGSGISGGDSSIVYHQPTTEQSSQPGGSSPWSVEESGKERSPSISPMSSQLSDLTSVHPTGGSWNNGDTGSISSLELDESSSSPDILLLHHVEGITGTVSGNNSISWMHNAETCKEENRVTFNRVLDDAPQRAHIRLKANHRAKGDKTVFDHASSDSSSCNRASPTNILNLSNLGSSKQLDDSLESEESSGSIFFRPSGKPTTDISKESIEASSDVSTQALGANANDDSQNSVHGNQSIVGHNHGNHGSHRNHSHGHHKHGNHSHGNHHHGNQDHGNHSHGNNGSDGSSKSRTSSSSQYTGDSGYTSRKSNSKRSLTTHHLQNNEHTADFGQETASTSSVNKAQNGSTSRLPEDVPERHEQCKRRRQNHTPITKPSALLDLIMQTSTLMNQHHQMQQHLDAVRREIKQLHDAMLQIFLLNRVTNLIPEAE